VPVHKLSARGKRQTDALKLSMHKLYL
jgi:hypothetical protein